VENKEAPRPIEDYWPTWSKEAAELVGYEVVQKIMDNFGGTRIYIPSTPRISALIRLIGIEAVLALGKKFRGMSIEVPKGDIAAITMRNRMIAEDRKAGLGTVEIARKYRLTERGVRYIYRKI